VHAFVREALERIMNRVGKSAGDVATRSPTRLRGSAAMRSTKSPMLVEAVMLG